MQRFVDRVLVIFPFEVPLYERAGIPVEFVGHPLVDLLAVSSPRDVFLSRLGLEPAAPTVALLPGSRANEVRVILPGAARRGRARRRARAGRAVRRRAGARASMTGCSRTANGRGDAGCGIAVVEGEPDAVLASADVVVTASGTATVQSALHDRPMVIVYRLSPLTYRLGLPFVNVDTYGMVNLVAGRRVVPELMQEQCTPETIAAETLRYLLEPEYAATVRAALAEVRATLGGPGASRRAAEAVLRVAGQKR